MPSDDSVGAALAALEAALESFRSTVAVTVEAVRGLLDSRGSPEADSGQRLASELGLFANDRIDSARLAKLLVAPHSPATFELAQIERALDVLRAVEAGGDDQFVRRLEAGTSLTEAVSSALADLGRVFGAARVVELVRSGQYRGGDDQALEKFPYSRWNRAERAMAPPLVVELDGEDLAVGGLADFLDGSQKLVLVTRGSTPPAALVRLITPGVLVLQTDDPEDLGLLAHCPGPAVAAVVPVAAPRFVHTPERTGERAALTVERMPDEEPRASLRASSAFQQGQELRQLADLARARAGAVEGEGAGETAFETDPAGKLAAWLVEQADLSELATDGA